MPKQISLVGLTFGKWKVLADAKDGKNWTSRSLCQCSCGKQCIVFNSNLISGKSHSCLDCALVRHGHWKNGMPSRLYKCWERIRSRCNNPNDASYKWYGAIGIKV